MIVRPRPRAWQLFFVGRGSIIPRIAGEIAAVAAFAVCVVLAAHRGWIPVTHLSAVPFSLFGLALSVFLGFRNSVCYDRWWEARRQWGALIVATRSLAREGRVALGATAEGKAAWRRIALHTIVFAHVLAARLRGRSDSATAGDAWLDPAERQMLQGRHNRADGVLYAINADLDAAQRRGELGEFTTRGLLAHVHELSAVQAACERIRHTPVPFAYSLLLHRTAWLFCLLLPFGLAELIGWGTPIVVAVTAYTFFGLDALGDELEDPFGHAENDLPLDALVRTVEIDVLEQLGHQPLPEPLLPVEFLLS